MMQHTNFPAKHPPLIGLSSYAVDEKGRFSLPKEYVQALVNAGAVPILIPPTEIGAYEILQHLDGLVLTGGGDISPELYGGDSQHPSLYGQNAIRDDFERRLIAAALPLGIPLLGICRGMQLLNVVQGGTLHVHLPDAFGEQLAHRSSACGPIPHRIHCDPESRLGQLLGNDEIEIASWHHQAIDRLGADLAAVAWASDGVIEALELVHHPWCMAVQWHPELSTGKGDCQPSLWLDFVSHCVKYSKTKI